MNFTCLLWDSNSSSLDQIKIATAQRVIESFILVISLLVFLLRRSNWCSTAHSDNSKSTKIPLVTPWSISGLVLMEISDSLSSDTQTMPHAHLMPLVQLLWWDNPWRLVDHHNIKRPKMIHSWHKEEPMLLLDILPLVHSMSWKSLILQDKEEQI